ncbi:T9SS type A sorting domain-containing protein [Aquimarina mytili]|uniref:T9SS type A sorting domain-containing protein n=1 Tax=Aquimarina mytili TaxID=874423 RepID=A0A937A8E6_9FLAO|nr:T9SS type A sorting domain-containing protein [Aquimarina mytili]MBL0686119.1 T9SS type A sorting domain-containing protein [Aquimarina mytili]
MKHCYILFLVFLLPFSYGILASENAISVQNQDNKLIITEINNVTTNKYPVQIGRPFVKGEITDFPEAVIDGTTILTQADVKNRYEDGSVKFAIISFLIPTLEANASVTVTFQNQVSGQNIPLTKQQMLDSSYDFDAVIELINGGVVNASARQMLQNNDYVYWTQGPIATTVIIADHSNQETSLGHAVSKYDIGFDGHRSFRPIFQATFWPGIHKVMVRFIGEVSNTESLQDVVVNDIILKTGLTSPTIQYDLPITKSPLKMYVGSRWTKKYWINGQPSDIVINHNLEYLIKTKYLPNYDVTKTIDFNRITSNYTTWSSSNDIYDHATWQRAMPTTGGRMEIGPYPTITSDWFFTWTKKATDVAYGHADLAAAWPVHFREGNITRGGVTRYFDRDKTTQAIGKPISVIGRPTLMVNGTYYINNTSVGTKAIDFLNIVGDWASNAYDADAVDYQPWVPDAAHTPDPFSVQYMLSGDYFYLEELYFWASYHSLNEAPIAPWGRGLTGAYGGIQGQIRGDAWVFRNRIRTALLSPDHSPEKTLFTDLIHDAIALWEGQRNVIGSTHQSDPMWNWGNTVAKTHEPSPLKHWNNGTSARATDPLDVTKVSTGTAPWEHAFLLFAIGQAQEIGYAVEGIREWFAPYMIEQMTTSGYNPHLIAAYSAPVQNQNGEFFQDWLSAQDAYLSDFNIEDRFNTTINWGSDSYPHYALGAMAMIADLPGAGDAWTWIQSKVLSSTEGNPKWAILPRKVDNTIPDTDDNDDDVVDNDNEISNDNDTVLEEDKPVTEEIANTIYPIPTNGTLFIKINTVKKVNFKLYTLTGKLVFEKDLDHEVKEIPIDITSLTDGFYILKITANKESYSKKIALFH